MSLPKIDQPIYNINVPSLKKKYSFRPFLVKEEKLLLMAKESDKPSDILSAIKQVVNNCSLNNNLNVEKLPVFDLEYIFLKLRAVSVDNVVKIKYKDFEDNKEYDFEIDLNSVEVDFPEKNDPNIKITSKSGILMHYPTASLYDDKDFQNLEKDYMFELIVRCVDKIYYEEDIYEAKEYKKQELVEFLENLTVATFEKILNFLTNMPKIHHEIVYKNSLGNERKIEFNSLNDFFMWR
jgi:hypothetical protein